VLRVECSDHSAILEIPGWLPSPEYRWLSLHAAPVADSKGLRWALPANSKDRITQRLAERLGLTVEEP